MLRSLRDNRFVCLLASRQIGKTTLMTIYCLWIAAFQEDQKGTIEVGKLADLTIFSKDIMTVPSEEILNAEIVMTVVNGKIVFQRERS